MSAPAGLAELAVVGLVRNGQATLAPAVRRLAAALPAACRVHWQVIESDSDDGTATVLDSLASEVSGFGFQRLGPLREQMPQRTARIAHCRNAGLAWLEALRQQHPVSHLLMADLDGVNDGLNAEALATCWQRDDWAGCSANQHGRYYDIWALRHPQWCPGDCWAEVEFLVAHGLARERATLAAVYARMLRIAPESDWIEVESAFGGLAVYRCEAIAGLRYDGLAADGAEVCEHLAFHQGLRQRGGRLFINPRLLNGSAGESAQYWPGLAAARRHVDALWFRALLKLGAGGHDAREIRRLIKGLL
jgi:hypothetical protein